MTTRRKPKPKQRAECGGAGPGIAGADLDTVVIALQAVGRKLVAATKDDLRATAAQQLGRVVDAINDLKTLLKP